MDDTLAGAREIRDALSNAGLNIYDSLADDPELVFTTDEIQALLRDKLLGLHLPGPIRTRSKTAKQAVSEALGYPPPKAFRRVKPRFPGQDLDGYVQKHTNLQVWNEELSPSRRFAVLRVDDADRVNAIRVVEGVALASFDKTGTLTSKFQAKRILSDTGSKLVSQRDTDNFLQELQPADNLPAAVLRDLEPAGPPAAGRVLTIAAVHRKLAMIVGREIPNVPSERLRGESLHRIVCQELELGSYADTGQFPDVVSQAIEVKMQTASTVDLGLVNPSSVEPAFTLSPRLVHADVRYVVAYAEDVGANTLRVTGIVTTTGADFFSEFQQFGGLTQNRKLQLHLPSDFFDAK